jgi:hypothetical protein
MPAQEFEQFSQAFHRTSQLSTGSGRTPPPTAVN